MRWFRAPWYSYPWQWLSGLLSLCLPRLLRSQDNLVVLTAFHGDGYQGNTRELFEALRAMNGSAKDDGAAHDSEALRQVQAAAKSGTGTNSNSDTRTGTNTNSNSDTRTRTGTNTGTGTGTGSQAPLQAIWLSRNPGLVRELQARYGSDSAAIMHSFVGLCALARARIVVFTHGTSDFPFLRLPRRAHRLQTYHGLPTKRGEYLRPGHDRGPGHLHRLILRYRFSPITAFLSSSPTVTQAFSQRFGIPVAHFYATGFPYADRILSAVRNPDFWTPAIASTSGLSEAAEPPQQLPPREQARGPQYRPPREQAHGPQQLPPRVIVYAPTYRRHTQTRWFPFPDVDLHRLGRFLSDENLILALRAHPNESTATARFRKYSPRIIEAGIAQFGSVEDVLAHSDVVVTDYSSIYLEGLLRDLPVVFLPYDLNRYERGFLQSYAQVTPGPHPATQQAFEQAIREAVGPTRAAAYREFRQEIGRMYWSDQPASATRRVIRLMEVMQRYPVGSASIQQDWQAG